LKRKEFILYILIYGIGICCKTGTGMHVVLYVCHG